MRIPRYFLGIALLAVLAFGLVAVLRADPAVDQPAVYAASSLRNALRSVEGDARYAFGGSGLLQRQVEQGAPADVFASAGPKQAEALFGEGRCEQPVTFATNRLVLLVPAGARTVTSVADLRRGGLRLALGTPDVPVGAYARVALARLGLAAALTRNRVSAEPDVAGVVAKVALGSADAGFAYHSDALAGRGRVREIALPARARPAVRYEACVVRREGARTGAARAYLRRLTGAEGQATLRRFGFGAPPRR